jgi:putative OPT family oligopeptide transporter
MVKKRLELTIKALLIGLLLAIVFCGTNVYLGLKIGNTISASVPAAVLTMGFLRLFKKYSTLENSISQTTASVGEGLAVAVIFIFPALLILNVWSTFNYLKIIMSILPGAVIGVVYSIILRKVLLDDKQLGFPEGQAIGKVLQATEKVEEKGGGRMLVGGMLISGITSFCQIGLQVLSGGMNKAIILGGRLFGGGVSFSVAIMSAGFLVGFAPMFVAFLSFLLAWCVLLPIFSGIHGVKDAHDTITSAFYIWKNYIRPIGIGVFIFTGFATIAMLAKPIVKGLRESAIALKQFANNEDSSKDLNVFRLLILVALANVPMFFVLLHQLSQINDFTTIVNVILTIAIILVMLVVGFAIAAVSGYFAGLAGSTSSPVSGLLFIAVIVATVLLQLVTRHSISGEMRQQMLETIIFMVGFIAGTAVVTNGSIQDFKSGQIVGATPYKQQLALFCGVLIAALVAPIFITLIFHAYGIAGIVPHAGMNPNNTLSAPQASAVAALTNNILCGSQDWNLIIYGVIIGFVGLVLDLIGRKTGKFRCSLVSIGMGIYLPPDIVIALFIGGCLNLIVKKRQHKISQQHGSQVEERLHSKANLLVCGLIAGESLMGLFLAIPFVIYESSDALKIVGNGFTGISNILSIIVSIIVLGYIYLVATKVKNR